MDYKERELLSRQKITLDGDDARIIGLRLEYAIVRSQKQEVVFSWPTVKRVIEKGGRFKG